MDNPAFETCAKLIEELEAKGYGEDKVKIEYQNAQGDASNLNTIVQNLVQEEVDVLAPIATPAAQACVAAGSDIPVFFTSVSDPVAAGIISDMEKPDKNATGTSNAIPVEDIFALMEKLTPDVKTVGIVYNTSEDNAVSTVESAKAYLEENGYTVEESVVTNSSEVQQACQNLFQMWTLSSFQTRQWSRAQWRWSLISPLNTSCQPTPAAPPLLKPVPWPPLP